ncbi:MAG: transposase [Candidatus Methanoperedenaceae archaeon]|nr:transposase [Candidatus Methanoperedenaceae archaeon]
MKTRKKFTREAKITLLRELENGKSSAQVCRENGIHPSMLSKWKREYKENPVTAFSGNGNISKPEAKLAESGRLIGQLYAENAFLKKVLTSLEAKLQDHQKQREGN